MINFEKKGEEYGKKALDLDEEGKEKEALFYYLSAAEAYNFAKKYENEISQRKLNLETKAHMYLKRAEKIQLKNNNDPIPKKDNKKNDNIEQKEIEKENNQYYYTIMDTKNTKIQITFNDIAGLKEAKEILIESVLLPLRHPSLFQGDRKPWSAILLYGPPGTGKTLLAKAIANESNQNNNNNDCNSKNVTFISINTSDILSKWQGESEKNVKKIFEFARNKKPCILFVDEIDAFCSERNNNDSDSTRRIKTEFLTQLDGIISYIQNEGILFLGCTNHPWDLDKAMLRRFSRKIYIPLPDENARKQFFEIILEKEKHTLNNEDIDEIIKKTDGYSGSDLHQVIQQSLMIPINEIQNAQYFEKKENGKYIISTKENTNAIQTTWKEIPTNCIELSIPLTKGHLLQSLDCIKPNISNEYIEKYKNYFNYLKNN